VIAGHGRENYERLAQVKAEYDPDNVFSLHHNIKPSAASSARSLGAPDPRLRRQRALAQAIACAIR
jgi:Berberine and berberine like